jgi:hypothetical protein
MWQQCITISSDFVILMVMSFFGAGFIYLVKETVETHNRTAIDLENYWAAIRSLKYRMDAVSDELYKIRSVRRVRFESESERIAKLERQQSILMNAYQQIVEEQMDDIESEYDGQTEEFEQTENPTAEDQNVGVDGEDVGVDEGVTSDEAVSDDVGSELGGVGLIR